MHNAYWINAMLALGELYRKDVWQSVRISQNFDAAITEDFEDLVFPFYFFYVVQSFSVFRWVENQLIYIFLWRVQNSFLGLKLNLKVLMGF